MTRGHTKLSTALALALAGVAFAIQPTGSSIASEPQAARDTVINVREPQLLSWDRVVLRKNSHAVAKSVEIHAERNEKVLASLEIMLGTGARYSIPISLLQQIESPRLETLIAADSIDSDRSELIRIVVYLDYGERVSLGELACLDEFAPGQMLGHRRATIDVDLKDGEITRDLHNPCRELIDSTVVKLGGKR